MRCTRTAESSPGTKELSRSEHARGRKPPSPARSIPSWLALLACVRRNATGTSQASHLPRRGPGTLPPPCPWFPVPPHGLPRRPSCLQYTCRRQHWSRARRGTTVPRTENAGSQRWWGTEPTVTLERSALGRVARSPAYQPGLAHAHCSTERQRRCKTRHDAVMLLTASLIKKENSEHTLRSRNRTISLLMLES